ncbi:MAG: hypothetical protein ACRDNF_26590 [Streptosporangiaceae bacterium]
MEEQMAPLIIFKGFTAITVLADPVGVIARAYDQTAELNTFPGRHQRMPLE